MFTFKKILWQWRVYIFIAIRFFFFRNTNIKTRYYLPFLLRIMKLDGNGVEVGCAMANFSEIILRYSKLSCLYSIDPWKEFLDGRYIDANAKPQVEQEMRYKHVQKLLCKYGKRSKILRLTSEEAVSLFAPEKLDFIYIDANHKYEFIKQDLELWWPKLKRGGYSQAMII